MTTTTINETDLRRRDLPREFSGRPMLEMRMDGDKPKTLTGYGAVFYRENEPGTEYWLWSDLVERIMPGAFDRALREDDVRAFFNHAPDTILGRRALKPEDTLRLSVDNVGLRYEIDFDSADPDHQRIFPKVASRKVDGSSFMFVPTNEVYRTITDENDQRIDIIEVVEVRLWEVGPVVFPAYEGTTSETRRRMSADLTTREREARDRRAAAGVSIDERRARLRLRTQVDDFCRRQSLTPQ